MDTKALRLESRFSLPPNSLGYCGRNTAAAKFENCIINGNCDGIKTEVKNFIVLWPYLKTIAQISKKDPFDYEVIEAYWIGNSLLKKSKPEHYGLLLKNFKEQGVPDFFIEELRSKKPKKFIPNHLFQVLHVGVGRASNTVPFNLESINHCMIRWGRVTDIKGNKAIIKLNSLKTTNCHCEESQRVRTTKQSQRSPQSLKFLRDDKKCEHYQLTAFNEILPFNQVLVPRLKNGDIVTVHWSTVIKILTKDEEKKLSFWTEKVLESISIT